MKLDMSLTQVDLIPIGKAALYAAKVLAQKKNNYENINDGINHSEKDIKLIIALTVCILLFCVGCHAS